MPDRMLWILCEGATELAVLKTFLQPYWSVRFAQCEVIRFDGAGDLKNRFKQDAEQPLSDDPACAVLCLLDLHEEPFGVYRRGQMTHAEGFSELQKQLRGRISPEFHPRFGAFPIVMELETWLLADPQIQEQVLKRVYHCPEDIEHPAEEFGRTYKKLIDGKRLFGQASAKRVYEDNCPYFKMMIDWLITEPAIVQSPQKQAEKRQQGAWDRERERLQAIVDQTNLEIDKALGDNLPGSELDALEARSRAAEEALNAHLRLNPQHYAGAQPTE